MSSFDEWRKELLHVGNIVQDSDNSVSPDESEQRFNRYIEMLDLLGGTEGSEYTLAIFESIQAEHDYGAYQTACRSAWLFGEDNFCMSLIQELPRLIKTRPDWAGDFMVSIANGEGTEHESVIKTFNRHLKSVSSDKKNVILEYINEQEKNGWFEHRVGVLGCNA
jgi:hypothetical protein